MDNPKPPIQLCGNGVRDPGELCDGTLGLPESCSYLNENAQWNDGKLACSDDCTQILAGSCVRTDGQEQEYDPKPPVKTCGNNALDAGELCDGTLGIPESCSYLGETAEWNDGKLACSEDCTKILEGTCAKQQEGELII